MKSPKVANWTNWQEGEPNNLGGQVRNRRALGEENRLWDMMLILKGWGLIASLGHKVRFGGNLAELFRHMP